MNAPYPVIFDQTLQKTHIWLMELDERIAPDKVVRAVFKILFRRIAKGEIEDIKRVLPKELEALWP